VHRFQIPIQLEDRY